MSYRLNERDEISFVGDAWDEFALANGGDAVVGARVLNRPLWSFIADMTTRQIYHDIKAGRIVGALRELAVLRRWDRALRAPLR